MIEQIFVIRLSPMEFEELDHHHQFGGVLGDRKVIIGRLWLLMVVVLLELGNGLR